MFFSRRAAEGCRFVCEPVIRGRKISFFRLGNCVDHKKPKNSKPTMAAGMSARDPRPSESTAAHSAFGVGNGAPISDPSGSAVTVSTLECGEPYYDNDGKLWHRMVGDDRTPVLLDDDTYQTHVGAYFAAQDAHVPFVGIYGIVKPRNPILDAMYGENTIAPLMQYLASKEAGDPSVLAWESLQKLIISGDVARFRQLADADPDFVNRVGNVATGTRPIHVACSYESASPILEYLLSIPSVDVNVKSKTDKSPLDYAVCRNNLVAVTTLLARRPDCNRTVSDCALPSYVENARVPPDAIEKLFSIMDILPEIVPRMDKVYILKICLSFTNYKRWAILRSVTRAKSSDTCMVCMVEKPDTVVVPCGHRVVCHGCSTRLETDPTNRSLCILCRQQITDVYIDGERMIERVRRQMP